jgi:hypothetical protein
MPPRPVPAAPNVRVVPVKKMSNLDFLRRYGRMGTVGLVGGTQPIDAGIRAAQKPLVPGRKKSLWSHALVFQGTRIDGQPWVVESDLDIRKGQARFGVQENRVDKYGDDDHYPNLAVLDFNLTEEQARRVVMVGLDLISEGTRYAIGGLFKTYGAILSKQFWKEREKEATFCSSFVRTLFEQINLDLTPGIAVRHTTPEHLGQCELPHTRYVLVRDE